MMWTKEFRDAVQELYERFPIGSKVELDGEIEDRWVVVSIEELEECHPVARTWQISDGVYLPARQGDGGPGNRYDGLPVPYVRIYELLCCANCDIPLTQVDYLCQECRNAVA